MLHFFVTPFWIVCVHILAFYLMTSSICLFDVTFYQAYVLPLQVSFKLRLG